MEKAKYEKPVVRDLDAVQPVQGSCRSGNIEYSVTDDCQNGLAAFQPCSAGTVVLLDDFCNNGDSASLSCWSGSSAA